MIITIITIIGFIALIYLIYKINTKLLKENMQCPNCNSYKVESYENNGEEYICKKCNIQWVIANDGTIIEL